MNEMAQYGLFFLITAGAMLIAVVPFAVIFRREEEPGQEPAPPVLGAFTAPVASMLPASRAAREEVAKELLRAGFFEPVAEVNFTALRSLVTYLPLFGGMIGSSLTEGNLSALFMVVGLVEGALGYALPRIILKFAADSRTERLRRGLPTLMDTLGLTLSTGSSLTGALASSGQAIRRGYPELAHEVRVVEAQAQMRSLSHALDAWKNRQPVAELGSLVFLLGQADRLGTDITRGLWELSGSLQVSARQRAEGAANRASFYMSFPTVLCLLVATGLVLAGPGVAQIINSNRDAQKFIQDAQNQQDRIRKEVIPQGRPAPGPTAPVVPPPPGL